MGLAASTVQLRLYSDFYKPKNSMTHHILRRFDHFWLESWAGQLAREYYVAGESQIIIPCAQYRNRQLK